MRRVPVLLVTGLVAASCATTGPPPVDYANQIYELQIERTKLQDELRGSFTDDAKLVDAPEGDVLIGLPASLVERVMSEAVKGPLANVRLSLQNVAKVEKKDVIRGKTFLGTMTFGNYVLNVDVRDVRATMRPKPAKLTFGANRIAIDMPISVEGGVASAALRFDWDGKNLAGAVCGDLTVEHELRAKIPTFAVRARGRFDLSARGEQLVMKPVLLPTELAFHIEPEPSAWQFVDQLIQSRNAVCEAALKKADVAQKVKDAVAQGFKVKLPDDWVRAFDVPISFRDTVDVNGRATGLAVTPTQVTVTKTRVWYGAHLEVKAESKAARPPSPAAKRP